MAPTSNWQSFNRWASKALAWGFVGAKWGFAIGAAIAIAMGNKAQPSRTDDIVAVLFGVPFFGALGLAAFAAVPAAWFLLLHMVSQLSGAARVPVGRDAENDEADDEADDQAPVSKPVEPTPRPTPAARPGSEKVCPDCGESVKAAARICRFCRYEFSGEVEG